MNYIKDTLEYLSKILIWWVIIMPWEKGLRTRFGKSTKLLNPGTHFRIPFFDNVYIQCIRLRVVQLPPQTISTKDNFTLTIVMCAGYSIVDIEKLYNTLYQPESTICNVILGAISDYISSTNLKDCSPVSIETHVSKKLESFDYGIKYESIKTSGYALVKAIRLIQDSHWIPDSLRTDNKS